MEPDVIPDRPAELATLRPRDAAFLEEYQAKGGTGAAAARSIGIAPGVARQFASHKLDQANVRDAMRASWAEIGLTPRKIGESLLKNLDARKGALTMAGEEGLIADPASSVQAARVAGQMLGLMPDPRLEVDQRISGAVVVQHLAGLGGDPWAVAEVPAGSGVGPGAQIGPSEGGPIDGEAREIS